MSYTYFIHLLCTSTILKEFVNSLSHNSHNILLISFSKHSLKESVASLVLDFEPPESNTKTRPYSTKLVVLRLDLKDY